MQSNGNTHHISPRQLRAMYDVPTTNAAAMRYEVFKRAQCTCISHLTRLTLHIRDTCTASLVSRIGRGVRKLGEAELRQDIPDGRLPGHPSALEGEVQGVRRDGL